MAKPRIFVSSTYYDLKHIRASLETFILSLGYEPVLFESGDIPFHHDRPLDLSCYDAVESAHIFVLIIGGRYGSSASGQKIIKINGDGSKNEELERMYSFYNSITVEEYKRARQKDVPIYIFLEKGVAAEYQTYKENKDSTSIRYAHVDNVSIFRLIDGIFSEHRNNLVREFETFDDISSWLKEQWAGLFSDYLSKRKSESVLSDLTTQVRTLNQVVDALRSYSEAIVRKVEPDAEKSAELIRTVEDKLAMEIVRSNPLIKYLRHLFRKEKVSEFSDSNVITAIAKSGDLDDFFTALKLPDVARAEALANHREPATRDFLWLRKQLAETTSLQQLFVGAPPVQMDVEPSKASIARVEMRQRELTSRDERLRFAMDEADSLRHKAATKVVASEKSIGTKQTIKNTALKKPK